MPPLLLAVAMYLVLALWLAHTKAPWWDEGQYVNPSYDLAFHGQMGSNVVEPAGHFFNTYFRGIQQRTYMTVPNQMVALASWFRIFGFSAFSARVHSICWGVVGLCALFYILQRLFSDRRVAQLATLFASIDFIYLWTTADARMDSAAAALALCSVAAYLHFREENLQKAVVASQILGASAVFTHPNAALVALAIGVLAWCYDRDRLRLRFWRYLGLSAAPYLFFGLLWSFYILQSPGDFRAQFFASVAGHNSERLLKILHPDTAIGGEIDRYLAAYCVGGLWGGVMNGWMVIVPLLYIPAMTWFLRKRRQHEAPVRMLVTYTITMALGMTFLNGFKGYFYLIYVLPIYNGILAAWLLNLWERSVEGKCVAAAVAVLFCTLQISSSILHIQADEYHRDYEPAVRDMARYRAEGKSIVGSAALGFDLGYSGFKDDVRLGMYSGLSPDVLVIDRAYRHFAGFFAQDEPPVFQHIVTMLSTNYRLTAQHGSFWIFERVQPGADGKIAPWIDVSKIDTVETSKRAEYLFRRIFSVCKMRDAEESTL
jgi:hypothetical protein